MIFELFVAAICAFIWAYTNPSTLTHQLAYNTMLIASVSTVIFNANPLLRYDGYYILSDWLEIPNLRQKSMEYTMGLIKRHVFRIKSPLPLPPVGQRFWLFIYAIASGIYRVFVGVMIILVVSNQVPVLGVLMALGGVITWLVVPVVKTLHYLLLDPELHRKRPRAIAFSLAVAGAIVILIGLIPFPMRYEAPGIIEPQQKQTLRARTPGFVSAVKVKDGQAVRTGDVLIEAYDRELDTKIVLLEGDIRTIDMKMQQGLVGTPQTRDLLRAQMEYTQNELARRKLDKEELTLRAPFDGVVVAPMIHELDGKYLHKGDEVATVIRSDQLVIRAVLPQEDAELVFMTEPMWWPLPAKGGSTSNPGWDATTGDMYQYLQGINPQGVKVRMRGAKASDGEVRVTPAAYTPGAIGAVPEAFRINSTILFGKPADIEVLLTLDQKVSTVIAKFADSSVYEQARGEYLKELGKPAPAAKGDAPTSTRWIVERDRAAVDVLLVKELKGGVTITYTLLGAKVDVRPASQRSKNFEARILSRFPAAVDRVPHPSITHAGGGDHQNDPRDQSGTKVTVPTFEVRLALDNANHEILPGQRATVRFTMEKNRPLIWQWGRRFWQLIQTQSQQSKWL
jgi:hypothetical protein